MIQFVKHSDINRSLWEGCVRSSENGMVNVLPWYLDIAFPNWNALVLNNYEAVMVLPVKYKMGMPFIYNPNFVRQLGIFSKKELNNEEISQFFSFYHQKGFYNSIFLTQENGKLHHQIRTYQSLGLKEEFELNDNTKRNIKKADKLNLMLKDNLPADDVFMMYNENRGQFLQHSEQDLYVLKEVMKVGLQNKQGRAFGVYAESGELITAAYVFLFEKTVYYLIGSVNEAGKKTGAMHWLFLQLMDQCKATHDVFDFGGSNIPSVAQFYKGLGGKDQIYYHYESGFLKPVLKMLKLV